jgi:protein arginine N-methyltransferase 1
MSKVDYLNFLVDEPRVEAFRRAIEALSGPGKVVLDVGTGIGTYAMFAARCGARVIAVEADSVIDIASGLANDNDLADRIRFLRGRTEHLDPPELADVLVFEDFSPELFHSETAAILDDLRRRWLTPDALSIPRAIRVMLAPVCSPESYAAIAPWDSDEAYGLNIERFSRMLLNELHPVSWSPEVLVAEPAEIAFLRPLELEAFSLDGSAGWQAARDGVLHGLGLWIDLELAPGVIFSNAPTGRSGGWDQVFLPLARPLSVANGDAIHARVTTLGPSRREPEWWSWRVSAGSDVEEMNTFRGVPLSLARLRGARLDRRPALSSRGRIRQAALELMDGQHSLAEIVKELLARFPDQIPNEAEARRVVASELEQAECARPPRHGMKLTEVSSTK